MPIVNQAAWQKYVEANKDDYGKCCVDVARQVMVILDEESGKFNCHKVICRADNDINAGGITGFMVSCVAAIVSEAHSRGEEFRLKWNIDMQIHDEGEKANASGGTLNPALLSIRNK